MLMLHTIFSKVLFNQISDQIQIPQEFNIFGILKHWQILEENPRPFVWKNLNYKLANFF